MAAGLVAWLAIVASDVATPAVLASGLVGVTLLAAALRWPAALGAALAALGGAYAVLLVIDDPPLDSRAAGVAAALLVAGELAGWARELGGATRDEPGNAWRRPIWIAGVALGALAVAWALLALADLARVDGLAVEAIGAVAAVTALVVIRSAARWTEQED